jgi:hypothetical protein
VKIPSIRFTIVPHLLNVLARLTSRDPEIAQVITDPQKVGRDGLAVWKVRINRSGVAEVEAAAEGFEPAVMNVVGMPGPGATFREAQLASLKTQMRTLQESTERAEERSKKLQEEIDYRQRNTAALPSRETASASTEVQKLEARKVAAVADAENYKRRSNDTRTLMEQFSSLQPPSMNESELKPGDVLTSANPNN